MVSFLVICFVHRRTVKLLLIIIVGLMALMICPDRLDSLELNEEARRRSKVPENRKGKIRATIHKIRLFFTRVYITLRMFISGEFSFCSVDRHTRLGWGEFNFPTRRPPARRGRSRVARGAPFRLLRDMMALIPISVLH